MADFKFPEFYTDRLHLRVGVFDDIEPLDAFFSGEQSRYVGGPRPRVATWDALCAGVGHWVLRGFGLWIVCDIETGTPMGVCGLNQPADWPEPELLWVIFDKFAGQGIASEAIEGVRTFAAREYGITRPVCLLGPEHEPVVRMVEKMGATRVADLEIPDEGPVPAWRFPDPRVKHG